MSRHIHAEVLARYRSGDLGERRSRRVRAHLAGCQRCATASSGLAEVSHLLRAAAAPPMPADITARIEAALAVEAAVPSRAAAAAAGQPEPARRPELARPPETTRRSGSARRASRPVLHSPVALRVLAGAAVAAVIVGGTYTATQLTGSGSTGTASSAAAGSSEAADGAGSASDSPNVGAPAAAPQTSSTSPAAAGGGSAPASSTAAPTLTYRTAHGTATFVPVAAQAGFARQGLAAQVGGLLRSRRHAAPLGLPSGASTSRFFSGIPVSTLEGCVSRVAAGGRVRLVDVGRYRGSKATIIVVAPATGSPQQIWVVGPGCSGSDPQVITRASLPSAG